MPRRGSDCHARSQPNRPLAARAFAAPRHGARPGGRATTAPPVAIMAPDRSGTRASLGRGTGASTARRPALAPSPGGELAGRIGRHGVSGTAPTPTLRRVATGRAAGACKAPADGKMWLAPSPHVAGSYPGRPMDDSPRNRTEVRGPAARCLESVRGMTPCSHVADIRLWTCRSWRRGPASPGRPAAPGGRAPVSREPPRSEVGSSTVAGATPRRPPHAVAAVAVDGRERPKLHRYSMCACCVRVCRAG